jgi:tRNA(Ile)-lysidine synthase
VTAGGGEPDSDAEAPVRAARSSGLLRAGEPLLVLLSGGGDSVCLLDVAVRLGARVRALHVNYGLREGADEDELLCRELCERLGVPLQVERVELPAEGNLQDRARDARYALAERVAEGDYAAAHTASDQAETVIYRLAVSPGSRALHGMAERRGRLVRPLLAVTRKEVRDYLSERGLGWREDPSNADRHFARARVRHDVLAALRELSPAAERTIAETARQLREEAEVLERAVEDVLGGERPDAQAAPISLDALRAEPPALQRLVLRRLAELAAGGQRSLSRPEAETILALGDAGSRSLDLGGGLTAVVEYGLLRFTGAREEEATPEAVELPVPGRVRFGDWEVEALLDDPGEATVVLPSDAATVRSWRPGDRMRPLGLGGTKTLQDLFTDRKVPRGLRHGLPVVEAGGEIVWVAGVALDERFACEPGTAGAVGLVARHRLPDA